MSVPAGGEPHSIVYSPLPLPLPIFGGELIACLELALLRWPARYSKIKRLGKATAFRVDTLPAVSFLHTSPQQTLSGTGKIQ